MRACIPSVYLTVGALAPAALWALLQDVREESYILFGFLGGAMTAASWLVTLRLVGHPLWHEVGTVGLSIRGRLQSLRNTS